MRRGARLQRIRLCLAILCVTAISINGSVVAQQRGDTAVSTAEATEGSPWAEIGRRFAGPTGESPGSVMVGDTYVLPSSGVEVVVGEGVSASDPEDSEFPDQILVSTTDGIGAFAVIQGIGHPDAILEAYVGGFGESMDGVEELDLESDRSFATGLYRVDSGSGILYLFITVDAVTMPGFHVLQVAVAGEGYLAETISLLRENVTMDGVQVFADVDENEVQDLVLRNESE